MSTCTQTAIEEKLHELCAAIVEDSEVQAARAQAEAFLADEGAMALYRQVARAGQDYEQKHHSGEPVTEAESLAFQSLQQKAQAHPLIAGFMEAQNALQEVANLCSSYVGKTLEKGRIPTDAEVFGGGSCGTGCGCH